jgi:glycosyltransferase 2 family protein
MVHPPPVQRALPERHRLAALLGVAAALGATGLIIRRTGATLADITFALPPWAHAAALLALVVHYGARTTRLVAIARGTGTRLGFATAATALLTGDASAAVTPSRVGSDPAKLIILNRAGHPVGTSAALLAAEMIAEVLTLTAVCLVIGAASSEFRVPAFGALSYAVIVLGSVTTLVLAGRRARRLPLPGWLRRLRLSDAGWRGFRLAALRFERRIRRVRRLSPATAAAVIGATALHMGARLAILPILGVAVAPAAPVVLLIVWPLLFLYAGALLPPPAGGGAIELAFAATIGDGVPTATLAGLLLWWRFYTFYLGALVGGIVAAVTLGRGRRPG